MANRQKWKARTAATFTSENKILLEGEPAIETDTYKWKMGDGSTTWNSLQYHGITQNPIQNIASSNYIYTFPTNPIQQQEIVLSWTGGDGSNQFRIDNADAETVKYGGVTLNLAAKRRLGEGNGFARFIRNGVNWDLISYSDSGNSSDTTYFFNQEWEKNISGSGTIFCDYNFNGETGTNDANNFGTTAGLTYYFESIWTFPIQAVTGKIPRVNVGVFAGNMNGAFNDPTISDVVIRVYDESSTFTQGVDGNAKANFKWY